MKKFAFAGLVLLLVLVSLWGVNLWLQGPTVTVVHATRGPAVQAVYATGTVEATVMMPIAARAAARLIKLNVDEGSLVSKGQVLAQLEDYDFQHSIKQLQAREEFAKKEYDRNATLIKQDSVSRAVYDQSKSDWEASRAATREAQAQADYLKLIAPADGLIIKRDGEMGQLIPANQPVFWLSCCAPLRAAAEVDEEDIAQVKPGQAVLLRADAFPGQIFHGRVQAITPKGDPVARSYRVRVEFADANPLQIGMTTETNIIVGEHANAILIPSSAVNQDKVWLVKEGHLVQQPVTVGAKGPELTEIRNGVNAEDFVVANPNATLKAGHIARAVLVERLVP